MNSYLHPFSSRSGGKKADEHDVLNNVIGVLPGKSLAHEIIIFSAHYDHVGVEDHGKKSTVFNGANDNASGTTALLALAQYFAEKADNERTIFFIAFAGEELGMLGSIAFANMISDPLSIKAAINIEMIGSANVAGNNTFFVTGEYLSDFQKVVIKNLKSAGSKVKVVREPDEEKMLFRRSDNFPLALKGIPAHTIMSSDDDDDCYHRACDKIERINLSHMINIINAIAIATETIISGKDTPKRIRNIK